MTVSSRALVELVLLGPTNDRRQLQDSPVLGDVWIAYAVKPTQPIDLLITPHKTRPAGPVADQISTAIRKLGLKREPEQSADIAYLQGLVAGRLFFEELLQVVVPITQWWSDAKVQDGLKVSIRKPRLTAKIQAVIDWAMAGTEEAQSKAADAFSEFSSADRYLALAGVILWAGRQNLSELGTVDALTMLNGADAVAGLVESVVQPILRKKKPHPKVPAMVWQVSLNRRAMLALERSVPSVKGDAARTLFNVKCDKITWAVLDSGIDGRHPVFKDRNGKSRILKAFDFTNIRQIVSLDNVHTKTPEFRTRLNEISQGRPGFNKAQATEDLRRLAEDAQNDRPIHWELVEKFISIDHRKPTKSNHGTHVAGIIGAYAARDTGKRPANPNYFDGMCPDITFYDFRVLGKSLQDTEFAIIAALQYLRYLNERHSYLSIHGANLSLSIPHDVRNFACGRTPICNECERLVESGVVVVAAAGNLGYQRFETKDGSYEGYTAFSVTDPGNADGVITVGATHRYRPHTYGVSFFSSRGPTGDGRLKPDLVAPGERIESCLPDGEWGELDGTSMAAPHVSGAAAMLMARYDELIGEPRRIKRILCESATDLGRERSFQGHGMLDVLRAFQSI